MYYVCEYGNFAIQSNHTFVTIPYKYYIHHHLHQIRYINHSALVLATATSAYIIYNWSIATTTNFNLGPKPVVSLCKSHDTTQKP